MHHLHHICRLRRPRRWNDGNNNTAGGGTDQIMSLIAIIEVHLIDIIVSGGKDGIFRHSNDRCRTELLHLAIKNKINNNAANHGKPGKTDQDAHDDTMPHGRIGCFQSRNHFRWRGCALFLFFLHH